MKFSTYISDCCLVIVYYCSMGDHARMLLMVISVLTISLGICTGVTLWISRDVVTLIVIVYTGMRVGLFSCVVLRNLAVYWSVQGSEKGRGLGRGGVLVYHKL